jgi:Asp-tRNA(Asn)/Glu-tRNA(Gln) amidotransferase A subunit family amidase
MTDLFRLGLHEIARGIRAGELTSEALVQSCLQRTAAMEDRIGAWQWLDAERALEHARTADRALHAGHTPGWLHGVPVGVKDIVRTAGIPTEMGSTVFQGYVPERSAAVVRRLEAAGAFVLGKTVTAELAYFAPGKTRNPWNPAHTPGGSSSGSAAAVAAGFVPAALGTQTNGSVIRPAAFCGVVGFKPSAGLISREGVHPFSATLDQLGFFTRSVDDAALMLAALAAPDRMDPGSLDAEMFPVVLPEVGALPHAPNLAAVKSPVWHLAKDSQQRVFSDNVLSLRSAGAVVEEVELDEVFNQAHDIHRTIMYAEAARLLQDLQSQYRHALSDRLNNLIDEGLAITPQRYRDALEQGEALRVELDGLLGRFDAIITLPAAGEAPATLEHTGDPAFCTIWTLCDVPAITIPVGLGPQGLPLGLQIVGRYLHDDALLSITKWCAEALAFDVGFPA